MKEKMNIRCRIRYEGGAMEKILDELENYATENYSDSLGEYCIELIGIYRKD